MVWDCTLCPLKHHFLVCVGGVWINWTVTQYSNYWHRGIPLQIRGLFPIKHCRINNLRNENGKNVPQKTC